jgi:hypothetical protein
VFLFLCVAGLVVTYYASRSIVYGLIGALVVFFLMFVGMVIAFLELRSEINRKVEEATEQFQKKMQETIVQERKLCGQTSVNMAKAVADRVSNRIIAKYISGMDNDNLRRNILEFTEHIVAEEIDALQKVVEDESAFAAKSQKKS